MTAHKHKPTLNDHPELASDIARQIADYSQEEGAVRLAVFASVIYQLTVTCLLNGAPEELMRDFNRSAIIAARTSVAACMVGEAAQ
ncbi:hypothetical protein [Pseudomonas syringae group genomosp. 3]|uniref:hypothetical protein n=1 Tax=Pseudomonas syringae group genomosp. 3 TaxID=251701 RepID=UPI000709A423|nr:hypothetical protein [Pseudomonas syringae group genomosp. 3]